MTDQQPTLPPDMRSLEIGWCSVYPQWRYDADDGQVEMFIPEDYRIAWVSISENDLRAMLAEVKK